MLYDPKWECKTETKADPYSLAGLIEWLETMPPSRPYNFNNCDGTCLLDRYIEHITGNPSVPSITHYVICGGCSNYFSIAKGSPWTFGAALERARAALASSPQ